jgi:hypothetical protein
MDDVTTRVVDDTSCVEEAAAPEAVCADGVAESDPERNIDHPGGEVHAAKEGACRDDEGNGCEDKLEIDHCCHRKCGGDSGGR